MANQVLAQSATTLATSNGVKEWTELEFNASVKRAAERASKGITRERQMLKRQSLIDIVKNDYRAHFAALFGKTDKLPTAIFESIETAVDKFIGQQLSRINTNNVLSLRRGFHWAEKDMGFTERINIVGENPISLEEQHLASTIYITQAEKRLKDLEAKKTPDLDAEKECKARIMRLQVTQTFIEGELKHQKELQTQASK